MNGVEHRDGMVVITFDPDDAEWLAGELSAGDGFTRDVLLAVRAANEWRAIKADIDAGGPGIRIVMVER